MATPPDPAKLLRWIIKETAVPNPNNFNNNQNDNNKTNNNQNSKPSTNNDDSNNQESIPVQRLADLDEEEKKKWTGIIQHLISGQTNDMLNNRASLQQAIERLHQIKNNVTTPTIINGTDKKQQKKDDNDKEEEEELGGNKEILACLHIIHTLLDKNEAVLAKLNGIPLLFELMQSSIDIDNAIALDCCTIIHDATQNNPMMQNHIYSHNGIPIVLKTLQNCKKTNFKIRAKLWALIHVISRDHNPNFNLFLTNGGHQEINRILRIEQSNINDDLLKEILRVARLINYMLGTWSDGNAKVFEILNILKSVNWAIYSLHSYVIRLVSVNPNQQNNVITIKSRMRTSQMILDILMELTNGIRQFMKRNDKCKKFVIANKNNKDITQKLKQLQKDLGDYCSTHRPNLKLEEKTKNGRPYRFKYYTTKNDDDDKDEKGGAVGLDVIDETKEEKKNDNEDDMDNGEGIYLAMKDIWNVISSILRHVKRYEDHCEQQRKLREIWKKTTKKGQHFAKKEKLLKQQKASKLTSSSPTPSSLSPPPPHQYQMVLYKKKDNDNDDDNEDETKNQSSTKNNNNNNNHKHHRQNRRSPHKNKKHHNHKKKRQKK